MRTNDQPAHRASVALRLKETLDQELRKKFGEAFGFKTTYVKETARYRTSYSVDHLVESGLSRPDITSIQSEIDSYIDGFHNALRLVYA